MGHILCCNQNDTNHYNRGDPITTTIAKDINLPDSYSDRNSVNNNFGP